MNRLRQLRGHIPRLVPETVERLILVIVLKGDGPVFTVGVLERLKFYRARVYILLFPLKLEIFNSFRPALKSTCRFHQVFILLGSQLNPLFLRQDTGVITCFILSLMQPLRLNLVSRRNYLLLLENSFTCGKAILVFIRILNF